MKAILNIRFSNNSFFLVPLHGKVGGEERLINKSKEAKIRVPFFEDAFLIIQFYWPNLCFLGIGVGVSKDNYIRKNEDNPGIGKVEGDKDKKAKVPGINIIDADKAKNPGTSKANTDNDGRLDNLNKGIIDVDGAKDQRIGITDVNKDRRTKD